MAYGDILQSLTTGKRLRAPSGKILRSSNINTCNACDPPIRDTLYVTLANLGPCWPLWEGVYTITWRPSGDPGVCYWRADDTPTHKVCDRYSKTMLLDLTYSPTPARFYIQLWHVYYPGGFLEWRSSSVPGGACDLEAAEFVFNECTFGSALCYGLSANPLASASYTP